MQFWGRTSSFPQNFPHNTMATTPGGEKLYEAKPDPAAQQFYKNYEVLAAASEADRASHADAFEALVDSVTASASNLYKIRATEVCAVAAVPLPCVSRSSCCFLCGVCRAVRQFIPQFLGSFPALAEKALSKLLDLVEDTEQTVRVRAIGALPGLCTGAPFCTAKTSDVLGQLLLVGTKLDQVAATEALQAIFAGQAKDALGALFAHVAQDSLPADQEVDPALRERVLEFLTAQGGPVSKAINALPEPDQEYVVAQVQRIITAWPTIPQPAFQSLFGLVSRLPLFRGPNGQPKLGVLVGLLESQSGLFGSAPVDVTDAGALAKLKACFALAGPIARRQRDRPRKPAAKPAAPAAGGAGAEPVEAAATDGDAAPAAVVEEAVAVAPEEPAAAPAPVAPYRFLDAVATQVFPQLAKLSEVDTLELLKSYALSVDLATAEQAEALLALAYQALLIVLSPVSSGADEAAKVRPCALCPVDPRVFLWQLLSDRGGWYLCCALWCMRDDSGFCCGFNWVTVWLAPAALPVAGMMQPRCVF